MRQILSVIHFFFMIVINFLLYLVNLRLNITKRPLLALLHLNHHLLNLLKLLETICLHFFQLLLLLNQHVETCLLVSPEESVYGFVLHLQGSLGLCFETFVKLICRFDSRSYLKTLLLHNTCLEVALHWRSWAINN